MTKIDLMKGDCLELMKDIPNESVDLIICDLPYGTTASHWDKIIDFNKLWSEYERIITNQGAIVLFSSGSFTNKLINSNEKLYRYKWIWVKNTASNFINAKNRPLTSYEEICVFSKGITANTKHTERKMIYKPQGIKPVFIKRKSSESAFGTIVGKRPSHKKEHVQRFTNYPKDVLTFNTVSSKERLHTNQKPVDLLEYLIKTYTDENMTVLDNCMGSGSTGVACVNTNRNFIGIELDNEYFETSKERIEKLNNDKIY